MNLGKDRGQSPRFSQHRKESDESIKGGIIQRDPAVDKTLVEEGCSRRNHLGRLTRVIKSLLSHRLDKEIYYSWTVKREPYIIRPWIPHRRSN